MISLYHRSPLAALIQRVTLAGLILADFSTFYIMGLMAFGGA